MINRVLIVTNIPQPYRISLFNELDCQLRGKNIELKVVFASKGYKRRNLFALDISEIKFNYEFLRSFKMHFGNIDKTIFTYSGLNRVISIYKPDKIIVSGFSPGTMKIWLRSFFNRTNYVIWSGSRIFPGLLDSWYRKFQRRILIKRASAFICYGSKAKEYLVKMGAPEGKIFVAINTVDTRFFSQESKRIRSTSLKPEKKHLIYIGYLVPGKNVGKLIDVIYDLSTYRNDFVLDILGDGSERAKLEKMVAEKELSGIVKFHGFVQKKELPKFLAISSCFLFQTDFDVWGLVVNEAMAAGVPVLSSLNAGATYDLIVNGETGFAVNYNDRADVIKKVELILDDPVYSEHMRKNSEEFIEQNASIQISAMGVLKSVLME